MFCMDCEHWHRLNNSEFGTCSSNKLIEDGWGIDFDETSLIYGTEYELTYLKTGEYFGCIHFEER